MGRAADFFVSYTSADRAWAEWIAWQLEAEGYQVIVQAWDFTAGRDWAHEMQHATATAERVAAVLSATYLRSSHGEAEWRAFYAEDPSGERGLLLPVRVDEVDPPGLLKTRVYVDLVGEDAAGARKALLAAASPAALPVVVDLQSEKGLWAEGGGWPRLADFFVATAAPIGPGRVDRLAAGSRGLPGRGPGLGLHRAGAEAAISMQLFWWVLRRLRRSVPSESSD